VQQLCRFTDWGSLDHLVLDLPPGTGDVHITLGQTLPITTAVIVTTPQGLALADVRKGLDMFKALRVPSAAAVLNMAHFDAPDTGRRYFPFGNGGASLAALAKEHGIPSILTLPMDAALSSAGDGGVPVVLADPKGAVAKVYAELAERVAEAAEAQVWRSGGAAAARRVPLPWRPRRPSTPPGRASGTRSRRGGRP
jgi:ATP-binding protein involved in chromosome partitioning